MSSFMGGRSDRGLSDGSFDGDPACVPLGVKLKEDEKTSSLARGLGKAVMWRGERWSSGVSIVRLDNRLGKYVEEEEGRTPSGVTAPGMPRNLTRKGSVVVAAGEMVPSRRAVAVFIGDEELVTPNEASCCERERWKRERGRPPSSLIRRP